MFKRISALVISLFLLFSIISCDKENAEHEAAEGSTALTTIQTTEQTTAAEITSSVPDKINVKIANYNIHNGADVEYRYSLLAQDIVNEGAEIVALQEIDYKTARNGNQDTLAVLANKTGLQYYRFAPAMDYQGGQYGVGLLSKYPITETEIINLPAKVSSDEPRVCLHAKIDINGFVFDYFVTHLNNNAAKESLLAISKVSALCAPFIISGDFNTDQYSLFSNVLNSYIVSNDKNKIMTSDEYAFDNFVLSNKITYKNAYAKDTGHSDHYILVCDVTIPTK
ncbi:MAG: endonuclease/exonuclease/phosphatase family protein [Clostridia bacterium]|nr:endonuclease/exonuclease/phosphatase family protein [Clostridia bacterium]